MVLVSKGKESIAALTFPLKFLFFRSRRKNLGFGNQYFSFFQLQGDIALVLFEYFSIIFFTIFQPQGFCLEEKEEGKSQNKKPVKQ